MSYPPPLNSPTARAPYAISVGQNALLRSVFAWMSGGLLITAMVAAYILGNEDVLRSLLSPGKFIALSLVEIGLVAWLSIGVMRMSSGTATAIFLGYSALNGITLTPLALYYTQASITSAFVTTAVMFGGMSAYAMVSKRDLSSWGTFLMMGFFGMLIASVVNIFLRSDATSFVISVVGVIVFTGLTGYDVNRITRMSSGVTEDSPDFRRLAVVGALSLYLNFINLFISLLRLMGDRRN